MSHILLIVGIVFVLLIGIAVVLDFINTTGWAK
jgi:hypothetical protein